MKHGGSALLDHFDHINFTMESLFSVIITLRFFVTFRARLKTLESTVAGDELSERTNE